ncbi:universal stress protein [Tenacibaculum aestuarii]|uniref:universal stress protein n=1 Tax=Tenacibaculum aestuarii TaxID=362781 RepID=UPI003894FA63
MKQNKYKILVLSDLQESTNNTLKSAVSIAKMIQADITFFHAKNATDIVKKESQLSAMRTINKEYSSTKKKILNFITPISKEYDVTITYDFSFGNVKQEIDQYISKNNPDVIVLGKRKPSSLNITGDNLTGYILKNYNNIIFIAENNNSLNPDEHITLGLLNNNIQSLDKDITKGLLANTKEPLISFNFIKNRESMNNIQKNLNEETVNYNFDKNNNTIKNLSNYLLKNNVHLLHINRGENENSLTKSDIYSVINNLKTSLLVTSTN